MPAHSFEDVPLLYTPVASPAAAHHHHHHIPAGPGAATGHTTHGGQPVAGTQEQASEDVVVSGLWFSLYIFFFQL